MIDSDPRAVTVARWVSISGVDLDDFTEDAVSNQARVLLLERASGFQVSKGLWWDLLDGVTHFEPSTETEVAWIGLLDLVARAAMLKPDDSRTRTAIERLFDLIPPSIAKYITATQGRELKHDC